MAIPFHDLIFIGVIFFAAHLVSAVSGFGSNVLGLPLLALVVGLEPGKQSLVVVGAVLSTYLTVRWHKRINWRELLFISLVAGIGLIAGMLIVSQLNRRVSTIALAIIVIAIGLRGVLNLAPNTRAPQWLAHALLFLGGVVHGAFTTGGPLLTVYSQRALPHKSVFRATLSVVWLVMAAALITGWTITRSWDARTLRVSLIGLPFMLAGLLLGEFLHHRVDETGFRRVVNLTLIAVGAILLFSAR